MIKFELIDCLVEVNFYFYYWDVECVVNMIFDGVIDVFVCGDWVEFCGFGVFFVCQCLVCIGCNLCIGESVFVKEKYVFFFKIGKELCECVDGFCDMVKELFQF